MARATSPRPREALSSVQASNVLPVPPGALTKKHPPLPLRTAVSMVLKEPSWAWLLYDRIAALPEAAAALLEPRARARRHIEVLRGRFCPNGARS